MLTKRNTPAGLAIAVALGLAACSTPADQGESVSTSTLAGSVAGAGASSQTAAMQAWIATFGNDHPKAIINYDPVGSGGGREQFVEGAVAFAGTDAPLKPSEQEKLPAHCKDFLQLPGYISPIAVAFNVEGVSSLNMSPEVIASIFKGDITRWNDPKIAAENPGVTLPDLYVNPVHRSDGSGTTETFTEYLHDTAPAVWDIDPDKHWPEALPGEAAQQTSGVVQTVKAGNGSIGYADASQIGDLPSVKIKVGDDYVAYSAEAAAKLVEQSPRVPEPGSPHDYSLKLDREVEGGYPIVLVTYQLACPTYAEERDATLVREFLTYMFSAQGQEIAAQAAGSAPLSELMRTNAMKGIETIAATS